MVRGENSRSQEKNSGAFFVATLVLWSVSVFFEILFNRRTELLAIVAGCFFYQFANWVIRFTLSRDPLFVNTGVSLLHSSLTSISVILILINQWIAKGPAA
ncbi:Tlc domain-containing protein [Thalictrum thalictroides]|uniref:Tlc domain-containing protein n=1 Tax=Thalictrum thalictroides TaxID=46969 RepID=A0A7J6UYN8_THATH|nr:Tlc domain-containing protein [Thalictrum thalictroides]